MRYILIGIGACGMLGSVIVGSLAFNDHNYGMLAGAAVALYTFMMILALTVGIPRIMERRKIYRYYKEKYYEEVEGKKK